MSWLLWQNVMVTLAKCHGYFGKMSWLLWQNVMVTPLKSLGMTGLAGCLKRRSLKKEIKNKDLKKQSEFSTMIF